MATSNSTRRFVRTLIRDVRGEIRQLTPGDNGKRPRLSALLRRAERDLIDLARPAGRG